MGLEPIGVVERGLRTRTLQLTHRGLTTNELLSVCNALLVSECVRSCVYARVWQLILNNDTSITAQMCEKRLGANKSGSRMGSQGVQNLVEVLFTYLVNSKNCYFILII